MGVITGNAKSEQLLDFGRETFNNPKSFTKWFIYMWQIFNRTLDWTWQILDLSRDKFLTKDLTELAVTTII